MNSSVDVRFVVLCLLFAIGPNPGHAAEGAADPTEKDGAKPVWQQPGAEVFSPELQAELTAALEGRRTDYRPRTRHLRSDGSPRYANRLLLESSPYLQQHAHNPVNWYPWGAEAFATAERLGRPILLSVGYSTCHWCHVMEEESFEDEEIAAFLNANYIPIKVDREERPDIDSIYMSAVQMLTGRGGWPMTTWLTPQGQPFYGGTYFPARDGDRGTRTGFLSLLRQLRTMYDEQPDSVVERAAQLSIRIQQAMTPAAGSSIPGPEILDAAARPYKSQFDGTYGGLRRAPKFPSSLPLQLLMRRHLATGDEQYLNMVELTLEKMARGGIHDQVGGGFHRYSTDARWLVPHFEKMLYDNALLTMAYLEGYQLTGREEDADVARGILSYVEREMTASGGGFYSATDADSPTPGGHREEGWFLTWTPAELDAGLADRDAAIVKAYYGVTAQGNFEGRNILNVVGSTEQVAKRLELSETVVERRLRSARDELYRARARRPPPLLDDKILTSWNGLMISAFARAGFVLDEPRFIARGATAADFLLEHLLVDGRLLRSYRDGRGRHNAYLDDYAFLIAALLDLYETSGELRWLERAVTLQQALDRNYVDEEHGGYFMTSDDHESLLAREKPAYDGAEPSGNSVALMNLSRLHALTSDDRYRVAADRLLQAFEGTLRRSPRALTEMLLAMEFRASRPKEVVVVIGDDPGQAEPVLEQLRSRFLPHKVVVIVRHGTDRDALARRVPPAKGKLAREGKTTAYVCEQGVCLLPTTDPLVLAKQLTATITTSRAGSAATGQSAADTEKNRVKRVIDD
jgi:uncharacterized protein YyaL (SSP411 family)